jgi:hypothetical protein
MQWNDIKAHSPADFGPYLVTDGTEMQIMAYHGCYKEAHDWSSYSCNTLNVTHWMTLPELPKDESERL